MNKNILVNKMVNIKDSKIKKGMQIKENKYFNKQIIIKTIILYMYAIIKLKN